MKMLWSQVSDEDKLNERLAEQPQEVDRRSRAEMATPAPPNKERVASIATGTDYCQWSAGPNDTYRPSGPRREVLPKGVYVVDGDQMGPFFVRTKIVTDNLIELDDAATTRVLTSIRKFWKSRQEYVKRGVLYKRGLLLWGPAGSGKTATLAMLIQDLLRMNGLVFICQNPSLLSSMLAVLRRIEPERNLIVVMEDIDELVARFGEHDLLALLDGETQIDNVVNIATTNYPERLGARIVNRPSRFDERILVDMPNDKSRERYLRHIAKNEELSEGQLPEWVSQTKGFSIAHLRELVVAVFCLGQPFEDVLERLSKMQYQPKAMIEFRREPVGLLGVAQNSQAGFATSAPGRG